MSETRSSLVWSGLIWSDLIYQLQDGFLRGINITHLLPFSFLVVYSLSRVWGWVGMHLIDPWYVNRGYTSHHQQSESGLATSAAFWNNESASSDRSSERGSRIE